MIIYILTKSKIPNYDIINIPYFIKKYYQGHKKDQKHYFFTKIFAKARLVRDTHLCSL